MSTIIPGKIQLKAWSVVIGIFLLGCMTGVALDGIYRSRASTTVQSVNLRDGEAYFDTLKRELNLNLQQSSAIRAVITDAGHEYKAVCADVRPRYDEVRDRARARMRTLLTPEQQKRFDSLISQENCNCPDPKK